MATILVVDDRRADRERLVGALEGSGHESSEAPDAPEALAIARRDHHDVVIAAARLPTMEGPEFVRRLRADPVLVATPVIFSTTVRHRRQARLSAESCGVSHIFTKPIDPLEVLRTIDELLGPAPPIDVAVAAPRGARGRRRPWAAASARVHRPADLSRWLLQAQERERQRIARELHDEIGQSLTALKLSLQQAGAGGPHTVADCLSEGLGLIDQVLGQVRRISLDLRPAGLDDLGLTASLRWQLDRAARRAGFIGSFASELAGVRLPSEIETECFRIAQEALTNVMRHAHARRVEIRLSRGAAWIDLVVQDDGAGFDITEARGAGLGMRGMRERAALIGGRLHIHSRPDGGGVTVHLRVPIAWPRAGAPAPVPVPVARLARNSEKPCSTTSES